MPSLFEGDGQFDLSSGVDTDLHTVDTGYTATLRIFLCNRTGGAINVRLAISRAGAALGNAHYLFYDYVLAANGTLIVEDLPLNQTDVVRARASANGVSANVLIQSVGKITDTV